MARKNKARVELTPGDFYRGITIESENFGDGEGKLVKRELHPFVRFCRSIHKRFKGLGKGAKFATEHQEAVEFLGWDLKAPEFAATSKFMLIVLVVIGVLVSVGIFLSPLRTLVEGLVPMKELIIVYIMAPFVMVALVVVAYIQNYPISAAKSEQTKALTYVPEIVGYMIMSMKLVPNLEKAVEFSAEHGTGKIANDFKKIMWDTNIGVYATLSEALDALAYRWGKYSDEFKHALMMIRASVLENTEAKRYQILDKTMTTILESIRDKMGTYARELNEPSILLFYLGVLLPLILIIVLPVGSAFSGQAMASTWVLVSIYNIIIPVITFVFARHVLSTRPHTSESALIPDDYPGLPPKNKARIGNMLVDIRMLVVLVILVGVGGSYLLSVEGIPPKFMTAPGTSQILPADKQIAQIYDEANIKDMSHFEDDGPYELELKRRYGDENGRKQFEAERTDFFINPKNDATPYNLIFGGLLTISFCVFIYLHFTNIYKRKAQLVIEKMESEFKDSLYILASRMGENKPVEEALKHTRDFLPGFEISKRVFARTIENIELLGMPLEQSVFDANYGSLRNLPSRMITTGMRILVDSVNLGVNVAARTLISLSLQLRNNEKVNRELKAMISDTTGMMRTMSIFIAPIVLGVTTALQKVVMLTMNAIQKNNIGSTVQALGDAGTSIPGGVSLGGLKDSASMFTGGAADIVAPWQFLIIVATYVLQLVFIMVYFSSKIEEDNDVLFRLNLAKALPIATTVFLVSVMASSAVVGNFSV